MAAKQKTLNRLEYLEQLYRRGYQSDIVDRSLEKILEQELIATQSELTDLQTRLQAFEKRYQMPSTEFFEKFQAGELGDDEDFMDWSAFFEMHQAVDERLSELQRQLRQ